MRTRIRKPSNRRISKIFSTHQNYSSEKNFSSERTSLKRFLIMISKQSPTRQSKRYSSCFSFCFPKCFPKTDTSFRFPKRSSSCFTKAIKKPQNDTQKALEKPGLFCLVIIIITRWTPGNTTITCYASLLKSCQANNYYYNWVEYYQVKY